MQHKHMAGEISTKNQELLDKISYSGCSPTQAASIESTVKELVALSIRASGGNDPVAPIRWPDVDSPYVTQIYGHQLEPLTGYI